MISTRTVSRTGGLLYLAVAVGGTFSELFVRSSVKSKIRAAGGIRCAFARTGPAIARSTA